MFRKPTYEDLEQKVKEFEQETEERKRSEEVLRESEERYRLLAENVTDVIWTVDADLHFTYVSPSIAALLGYSVEECLGQHLNNALTEESRKLSEEMTQKILRRLKENKCASFDLPPMEFEMLRKDGSAIWVEVKNSFLTDQEGGVIGLIGVTRNITERKRVAEALRKAKVEAESANVAKSQFLANMSHEIRTPINAIIGFTELLLDTNLDKSQMDYARMINISGDALLSLINDILDFSKIEAGELDFEEIDFDPELLAYDVCELILPRIRSKNIEILCRTGDDLPLNVKGDPFRFRQVLTNLMVNAAKFTEAGEIELSLDIEEEDDDRIKFHATVRDTAFGIPEEKLNTIFNAFQQADGSTTRNFGGTGLGLAICKQISNLMGGDVWVESEVNKGSIFHFTGWLGKAEGKEAKRFTSVSLSGKKVLIVGNKQTNLNILTHTLGLAGMRVVALKRPQEIIPTLQKALEDEDPVDLCISDIQMPGTSGYDLANQIRDPKSGFQNLFLIALSSGSEKDAKKCEDRGFDGFLAKPICREKLLQMIERIIGEREDEGERGEVVRENIMTQYTVRDDLKHPMRILLAEDNVVNQKLAKIMLTKAGYQVEIANNGQEAVELYTTCPETFSLIFMDVQMPKMDGIEATKALRKQGFNSIPIVAMTAYAMKGDSEKCLEAGMDDYIAKPIKREAVCEILEKWFSKEEAP